MYCGIQVLVILSFICISVNAIPPEYDEEICIGQDDGVLLKIQGDCTHYYYCEGEIGYLEDCLSFGNFQFDENIGNCNYPEEVNCVPEETEYPEYPEYPEPETPPPVVVPTQPPAQTTTTTTPPSDPNLIPDVVCPTDRPGEILFFESLNCTEYYICANGVKLTMKCIEGFVFNKDDNQCDHPVYNPRCSV
jgi:hypothetical protein